MPERVTLRSFVSLCFFEKQRYPESLLSLPSEQSRCQPLNCLQILAEDPTAALKYQHLKHIIKLDRNSPQTFRNSSSTKFTYASKNKTPKCYMELMLLSTPECCPQRKASVQTLLDFVGCITNTTTFYVLGEVTNT